MYNLLLDNDLTYIIIRLRPVLQKMKGKKIFITGGTGFFGKWLLETFAKANLELNLGIRVFILSRNVNNFFQKHPYFFINDSFSFIEGDILDFPYPEGKFDYIIHCATESDSELYKTHALLMFDTIVEGTRNILNFAVKSETKDILFISSGAVYGKQSSEISHISECSNSAPDINSVNSTYAEGKRTAEMLCALYSAQYNILVKIARCFAFVGPYLPLNKHFAIGNFIRDLIENKPIIIKGDGTTIRSYMYSVDLVIWLFTILISGKNCRPYNVGSENEISIKNLAMIISSLTEKSLDVKIMSERKGKSSVDRYVPSTERARKELSLIENFNIKESIIKTVNFHLAGQQTVV